MTINRNGMSCEKQLLDILVKEAEELDWIVDFGEQSDRNGGIEKYAEFFKYSPEGEDFSFTVFYEDPVSLVNAVREAAEDFDIDDHIEMWIEARNNGVHGIPSTRALVEDAAAIKEMMEQLASFFINDAEKFLGLD